MLIKGVEKRLGKVLKIRYLGPDINPLVGGMVLRVGLRHHTEVDGGGQAPRRPGQGVFFMVNPMIDACDDCSSPDLLVPTRLHHQAPSAAPPQQRLLCPACLCARLVEAREAGHALWVRTAGGQWIRVDAPDDETPPARPPGA